MSPNRRSARQSATPDRGGANKLMVKGAPECVLERQGPVSSTSSQIHDAGHVSKRVFTHPFHFEIISEYDVAVIVILILILHPPSEF